MPSPERGGSKRLRPFGEASVNALTPTRSAARIDLPLSGGGIGDALTQLAAHPFEFAADVIDDIAGLQIFRQHVPGIGLDLELARQWLHFMEAQRLLDGKARGAERAE